MRGERLSVRLVVATGLLSLLLTSLGLSGTIVELVRPPLIKLQGKTTETLVEMLQDYGRPHEQELAASGLAAVVGIDDIDATQAQSIYAVVRDMPIDEIASSTAWSELLIAISNEQLLTKAQMLNIIERLSDVEVNMSTKAWPGYLHITTALRARKEEYSKLLRVLTRSGRDMVTVSEIKIDGQPVAPNLVRLFRPTNAGGSSHMLVGIPSGQLVDLLGFPDGQYTVSMIIQLDVLSRESNQAQPPAWDRSSAFRKVRVERTIDISRDRPEPILVPANASLKEALKEATDISLVNLKNAFELQVQFDQNLLPIGISGEAVLRYPDDRLIYLGRVQVLSGRSEGDGSLSTYRFRPWQTGLMYEDMLVDSPVTVEVIPWNNHPMLRNALDQDEPLQLLADPVVLGTIQPEEWPEMPR